MQRAVALLDVPKDTAGADPRRVVDLLVDEELDRRSVALVPGLDPDGGQVLGLAP